MPVVGFCDRPPGFQCRFIYGFDAGGMRTKIPGSGVWVFETRLFAAAVVHERTKDGIWMVERCGMKEGWLLVCAINVNAVALVVFDLKE